MSVDQPKALAPTPTPEPVAFVGALPADFVATPEPVTEQTKAVRVWAVRYFADPEVVLFTPAKPERAHDGVWYSNGGWMRKKLPTLAASLGNECVEHVLVSAAEHDRQAAEIAELKAEVARLQGELAKCFPVELPSPPYGVFERERNDYINKILANWKQQATDQKNRADKAEADLAEARRARDNLDAAITKLTRDHNATVDRAQGLQRRFDQIEAITKNLAWCASLPDDARYPLFGHRPEKEFAERYTKALAATPTPQAADSAASWQQRVPCPNPACYGGVITVYGDANRRHCNVCQGRGTVAPPQPVCSECGDEKRLNIYDRRGFWVGEIPCKCTTPAKEN